MINTLLLILGGFAFLWILIELVNFFTYTLPDWVKYGRRV